MSPYRKNVLVGVTVLVALILLGWMILRFGANVATPFAEAQLPVRFLADRADGLFEGSAVLYKGVSVGQVTAMRRSATEEAITIDARLDTYPPLPANVEGLIRSQGLISAGVVVDLELTGPKPEGTLQPGATLPARLVGSQLIPPEVAGLAKELELTVRELRQSRIIQHLDETVVTTQQQIVKAGELIESLHSFVSDPKFREDLKTAAASFRSATESATRVGQTLEKLSANLDQLTTEARADLTKTQTQIDKVMTQLDERLRQTGTVLGHFASISGKIDRGQGTAGLFVNDPKLYQALVDTSRELSATIADLKRLVEQWEQEGATFKLR